MTASDRATEAFLPVARAIAAYVSQAPAPPDDHAAAAAHLRRAATLAVPRQQALASPANDYAAVLAEALRRARGQSASTIAAALETLPVALPWHYHYPPRPDAPDLARRIAFAELIGPDGPLDAPECRVGFTLMAPWTLYPLHAHPAVELYVVIAGHAAWTTPDATRIVPPGGSVLHHANQPHAMRSFAEPLLALYGWRGDIDTPAGYL